jgi:uncharacterized membrane protein YgcG
MKVTLPLVTLICLLQTSNAVDITAPRDLLRDEDNAARHLGEESFSFGTADLSYESGSGSGKGKGYSSSTAKSSKGSSGGKGSGRIRKRQ